MRPLLMSLLLLALSASPGLENDLLANDLVVALELRPAADVGKQATVAQGPAGEPAVEVTGGTKASTATLIDCDMPEFSSHEYVLRGRVKFDGVAGDGYLELWSDFGDKGKYFTRSLGDWGAMKKISGTSDWRDFELPFYAEPGMKLKRITLNVVLPGAGKVVVTGPLNSLA